MNNFKNKLENPNNYYPKIEMLEESTINSFESKYNFILPPIYRCFLKENNGGYLLNKLFFHIDNEFFSGLSNIYFCTLKSIESWIEQINDNEYDDIGQNLLKNKIICIGYSSSNGLPIGMSTITGEIGIIDYGMTFGTYFFIIANNFDEFINGFEEEDC